MSILAGGHVPVSTLRLQGRDGDDVHLDLIGISVGLTRQDRGMKFGLTGGLIT